MQGTAIFPAGHQPDGDQAAGRLPSSYEYADVFYLDANGRGSNVVRPGGYTTANWYDRAGNVNRAMTAANIQRALDTAPGDQPAQEADLAAGLSTLSVYSPDGTLLTDTFGPEHEITLPGSDRIVIGRIHNVTRYDEGAPLSDTPLHLPTTEQTSVSYRDLGASREDDVRTVRYRYDWTLGLQTAKIVDPDGLALTTRTAYDPATGLTVSSTDPAGGAVDNTPSTRTTIHYRAGTGSGDAECDSKPHWAGLICREQPGGQPSTGPALPTTVTTYDRYLMPVRQVEKVGNTVLRTVDTTYDAAGRTVEVAVTAGAGLGQAVPTQRSVYQSSTGDLIRVESLVAGGTAAVVKGYDTLGRVISYTDADQSTTTTTYDLRGRVATEQNGKGLRTYTYDEGTERRGLATQVRDSLSGGGITGEYDADGRLVRQTLPGGLLITNGYDEVGAQRSVSYDRVNCGQPLCDVYYSSALFDAHGQQRQVSSGMSTLSYGYDRAGRLTMTTQEAGTSCRLEQLEFDAASNRKRRTALARTDGGGCGGAAVVADRTYTYDSADRITGAYTYDSLGRTTTLPAADTADQARGNVTIGYHTTDLVRSITQGSRTMEYTLDVGGERVRSWTDNSSGSIVTRRHHYDDDSDSPSWTDEGDGSFTAAVDGLDRAAGTYTSGTGMTWQVVNLHGDVVATVNDTDVGMSTVNETDAYGVPDKPEQAGGRRYGYLGAYQRASDTPTGIVLMGVRLYNTVTGRFLSVDPVNDGSCNRYEYACADPVNNTDLDGKAALPAFLYAIAAAAKAIQLACRVSRKWCLRAILWVGKQVVKYLGRASRSITGLIIDWWHTKRVRDAIKCGDQMSSGFNSAFGPYLNNKFFPGAARYIGFVAGFILSYYVLKGACLGKGKYS